MFALTLKLFLLLGSPLFAQDCQYEFNVEKAVVEGTGYKFTQKDAVTARFSGFKINQQLKQAKAIDLLNGLQVTVDLMTIDSGNSLRDQNMRETLFSGILGDSVATVTVKKVNQDKIEAELTINEKTKPIQFTAQINDQMISAEGKFDALDFVLTEQISALKKRCGSLHTGSDGKSVTWTDFKIAVKAPLKKVCGKK